MKKAWHPYWLWEDYLNGMYGDFDHGKVAACVDLLSSKRNFLLVATRMVNSWPISAEENLTNIKMNRQAWVGQASCCFSIGASERTVRQAWGECTSESKVIANVIAGRVIDEYTSAYRRVHNDMGTEMLPGWIA